MTLNDSPFLNRQTWAKWRALAIGTGLAAALSGCMPANKPALTALALPEAYAQNAANAPKIDTTWPKLYRSPELETLIKTAALNNLDLAGAVARIAQADAQAASARAQLLPTLDGSVTAQRANTPGTSASNQFNAGLTASYALDVWGRYRSLQMAELANAEASGFDRDALSISIAASTATSYFNILAANDRIALQNENIRLANHILDAIRARVSVGTASALDVAEQESVVATQKAAIPSLEQQVMQGKSQLAILLGRNPEGFSLAATSLKSLSVPAFSSGLPSELLLRRPDIARAEAQLRAAEANLDAARAAYLPSFDLTLKGGSESNRLGSLLRPDTAFASALGGLTAPIFDGGSLDAGFALQGGVRDELVAAYRKAILSALGDVENALVSTTQSQRQEVLQGDVVKASRRAYAISEERLRAGTIDVVTLLTVQQTLFQAEDGLIQSRLGRLQASIALVQALGGGFDGAPDAAIRQRLVVPTAAPRVPAP